MAYYLIQYIHDNVPDARISGITRTKQRPETAMLVDIYYNFVDLYWHPPSELAKILADFKPDIIFHLASMANVAESFKEPQRFFENNVIGTVNLYEAIVASGLKPTVVVCSTSEVYGSVECKIHESQAFAPLNPYAITKVNQEYLAQYYWQAHKIPCVITRAFGYINPLRRDLFATAMARQVVEAERNGINAEIRHGNLRPIRTFCDIRDMAEAYWLAATKGEHGQAFNIGSENDITLGALLQCIAEGSNVKVRFKQDETRMRPTDILCAVPSTTKFRRLTGWEPKRTLGESLDFLMEVVRNAD